MGTKCLLFVSCYVREPLPARLTEYDVLIGKNQTHWKRMKYIVFFFLEFTYDLDIVIVVQEKILDFQVSELRSRNQ